MSSCLSPKKDDLHARREQIFIYLRAATLLSQAEGTDALEKLV